MNLRINIEIGASMKTANDATNAITLALLKQASSIFEPLNPHETGVIRDKGGEKVGEWEVIA